MVWSSFRKTNSFSIFNPNCSEIITSIYESVIFSEFIKFRKLAIEMGRTVE
jgi:hypothetical protein